MYCCGETCVHQNGGFYACVQCLVFLAMTDLPDLLPDLRSKSYNPTVTLAAASEKVLVFFVVVVCLLLYSLPRSAFSKETTVGDRNVWCALSRSHPRQEKTNTSLCCFVGMRFAYLLCFDIFQFVICSDQVWGTFRFFYFFFF